MTREPTYGLADQAVKDGANTLVKGYAEEFAAREAELKEEIKRLRAALTQFVACCETAPPTSLITELGMACKVARTALTDGAKP